MLWLVVSCREYNIALRTELARKEQAQSDPNRAAELAAYMTHAALQPMHLALALRSAMSTFFKLKNPGTCATFCRRLLEINTSAKVAAHALPGCASSPASIRLGVLGHLSHPELHYVHAYSLWTGTAGHHSAERAHDGDALPASPCIVCVYPARGLALLTVMVPGSLVLLRAPALS